TTAVASEPKKDGSTATKQSDMATTPAANATPSPANSSAAGPAPNGQPQASPATGDLSHELAAIDVRLSRMAAAPTNLWNTERLERDASQLMGRAQTPADRDAVRATQEKINRFTEIGRRSNQAPGNAAQVGQAPTTPPPNTVATTT